MVNFKTSALNEMRPAWEDVQRAADGFANSTVNVAAQGTNGFLYFGNETWTDLQAVGSPALAPIVAPKVCSPHIASKARLKVDLPRIYYWDPSCLEQRGTTAHEVKLASALVAPCRFDPPAAGLLCTLTLP